MLNIKNFLIGSAAGVFMFGAIITPAFASSTAVYDALPSVSPVTNYPSQPFQAQQTAEFGDYIHLGGTARLLNTVTVTLSDWALYSDYSLDPRYSADSSNWTLPITLNVYNVNPGTPNTVGALLGTVTQTISVPWRPASGGCTDTTAWKDSLGNCNHGLAFNAVFDLSSLHVTLPDDIIISVAFNTQTWGYKPIGTAGPYNSLNVAVPANQAVTVGSDYSNNEVFWNTETAANYADGGLGGVGTFREDTNWAPNGTVALQVTANTLVKVTIAKYLNGVPATTSLTGGVSYPMVSTWSAVNIGSGTGTYSLGPTGFNNPNPYQATTSDMTPGASYTTNEVTDNSSNVLATNVACQPGKTRLVGYSTGETLADATGATVSATVPNFTNLNSDEFVVVYNEICPNVTPTPTPIGPPTNMDQCKDNGWKAYNNPSFKNQGDCVSYVQSNSRAIGNKTK